MSFELKEEDYLKLWIYFADRADKTKDTMFKTLTWTIGFASALLGFIFFNLVEFDTSKARLPLSMLVSVSAAAGIVICLYSCFMIFESGKHIQRNLERAESCAKHFTNLDQILQREGKKAGTMKSWNQLHIIVALFALAFVAVLVWVLKAA